MIELKKSTGSSKLIKLTLVSLVISAILWLFWGFVTLRNTSCGWVNRLNGSDCVRIIPRDVDFGAENVYFSRDDSSVFFLDRATVKMVPVQTKIPFNTVKSYPVFSLDSWGNDRGVPKGFEGFALNHDEMKAVFCVVYKVGASDYKEVMIFQDLENKNVSDIFLDNLYCSYSEMNFVPSSSIVSLTTFDGDKSNLRFVDSGGDILHPIQGTHIGRYSDGTAIIPVIERTRVISLYSFPDLVKQNDFEFPVDVLGAQVSPDGRYIFASDFNNAKIYMLDLSTGDVIYTFSEPDYDSARLFSISPNGDLLAIAYSGYGGKKDNPVRFASIHVWDLNNKTVIKKISMNEYVMYPRSIDISANGKLLAVGTLYYVIIYDLTK